MRNLRRVASIAAIGVLLSACTPSSEALAPADAVTRYDAMASDVMAALADRTTYTHEAASPRARTDGEICRYDAGVWRPAKPFELPADVRGPEWQAVNDVVKPVLNKHKFGNGRLAQRADGSVLMARDFHNAAFLLHADGSFSLSNAQTTASPCADDAFPAGA